MFKLLWLTQSVVRVAASSLPQLVQVGYAVLPHDASDTKGPFAALCKWARPHSCFASDRCMPLAFDLAVQLPLRKKSAGSLQYLIGPAQLFDARGIRCRRASSYASINLRALDPLLPRLSNTLYLGDNGLNGRPKGRIFFTMPLHQTYFAFTHLGCESL